MGEETDFGLVMPFVSVASNGGPYDDAAYVAGWDCAYIDAALANVAEFGTVRLSRYVNSASLAQLDLVAMRRGLRMEQGDTDESGEWTWVTFTNEREENNG